MIKRTPQEFMFRGYDRRKLSAIIDWYEAFKEKHDNDLEEFSRFYGLDPSIPGAEPRRPDSDNKHQYEVHTHAEYCVEHNLELGSLMSRITTMMKDGWKPCGGIAIEPPAHREYSTEFYQAMVRGV